MNAFKEYRIKNRYSMQQLADVLLVSRQTIDSWEKRRTQPNASQIMDLHIKLDIPLNDLMEHFNNK